MMKYTKKYVQSLNGILFLLFNYFFNSLATGNGLTGFERDG